jgi:RNA polymerase sigma-70 factor (ECF subfamily)
MKLKDRNILAKIRKGDVKSFETLFHQYYPGMLLYAKSLVKNEKVAEEIVQDVFYNVWKNRLNFMLRVSWKSYLFGAVYNNSMYHLRKSSREQRLDERIMAREQKTESGPFEEINYKQLNDAILETMENLPERTRTIFQMSRHEGLTYPEIAKKLAISIKTVEANMGKALKAFRSSLREYGYVK